MYNNHTETDCRYHNKEAVMRYLAIIIGVLLVGFGIFGLAHEYYPYKTETNTAQIGPVELQTEHSKYIYIPPLASGISIAAGIIFLVIARRNKS
jgi:hypothetical protein